MSKDYSKLDWLIESPGGRRGPVSATELVAAARSGEVTPATPVSFDRGDSWRPYGEVAAELEAPPPAGREPATLYCTQCGRNLPASALLSFGDQLVCAECKPLFVQRLRAGQSVAAGPAFAGFWIRVAAKMIDGIILYAVNLALTALFGLAFAGAMQRQALENPDQPWLMLSFTCGMFVLQMLVAMGYTVFFLSRFSATPGKLLVRLRVVRSDGSAIGLGRSFGRHFADMLSSMILGIGYVMVAFDDQKRALHDHLCDTRVVRVG
jgi:uncharacterized RDD family membrane protein YckC